MARPRKDDRQLKRNYAALKLSDMEYSHLETCANALHVSKSEYLRMALMENTPAIRVVAIQDPEAINRIAHETEKIGVNLNQIAKYFNTGGIRSESMEEEIYECIHQLRSIKKELTRLSEGDIHDRS